VRVEGRVETVNVESRGVAQVRLGRLTNNITVASDKPRRVATA